MNTKKTALAAAIALGLGVGSVSMVSHAAVPAGTLLKFDAGSTYCTASNAKGKCIATDVTGTYFSMDTNGDGTVQASEKTPFSPVTTVTNGGVLIGATQAAGELDTTWNFFGPAGNHMTTSPITDTTGSGAATRTLDFAGWAVFWNSVSINMGGDQTNFPTDTGVASISCWASAADRTQHFNFLSDPANFPADASQVACANSTVYQLTYFAHVPTDGQTNFGGVYYGVSMPGTVCNTPPTAGSGSVTVLQDSGSNNWTPAATDFNNTTCDSGTTGATNVPNAISNLTCTVVSAPTHGTAQFNGAASGGCHLATYTPTASYAGADSFTYSVSDGADTSAGNGTVTVTVSAPPVITSNGGAATGSANVAENSTAVTTVAATDANGDTLTYSISGGADAAKFSINSSTGALTFASAPDFESPTDSGGNNVYDVTVQVSDGPTTDTQALSVTVTNVNETPVITSGSDATASVTAAENQTAVTTVTSTDVDAGDTLTYSIIVGGDSAKFGINSSTGALTFASAPDFETPTDSGGNNVYDVTVQVSDGLLTDTQAISVTVTNVNDNTPSITSGATASVAENTTAVTTVVATDADGSTPTYSISGGADAAKFSINSSTGALAFATAPDFETPTDSGGNNVYDVTVMASDGTNSATQAISVTVTNANDNTPSITSNGGLATGSVNSAENQTAVTTVTSTDVDGDTPTYSISGGADSALFSINSSTGALTFAIAPDFESPTDTGGNNVYDVTVQVSDGTNIDTQTISVTVTNANDSPTITSNGSGATASANVPESTTPVTTVTATDQDGDTQTYSISGGADAAKFSINSSTGALTFTSAPSFASPTDADTNNIYEVTVQTSDGNGGTDTQAISVTVVQDNAPVITSNGGGATGSASVAENSTAVTTVAATDADVSDTLTYSISGADAAKFSINSSTGALTFASAPDFETPTDANGDNVYEVTVQASDGLVTDTQALSVTVTNANDNTPSITGGATASPSVAENTTAVTTVAATDVDGDSLTYSISGGADQALFGINSSTGALTFAIAPDFETPADVGGNNVYDVIVQVDDGINTATQAINITVTNANDNAPSITSNGAGATGSVNAAENQTAVTTVTSTDADAGDTPTYSISGGADQALFSINSSTGALTFASAPDFESPTDVGANNVYDVTVQVSDGTNADTQALSVTVTNVNETPVITSNGGGASGSTSVAENTTAVTTATATDVDGDTLTYSISGGADQALFSINSSTGALTFASAPDFESPTDTGGNNVYDVTVQVSDGNGGTDTQAISVTVTNANDNAPAITSNGGGATGSVNAAENQTAVTTVTSTDVDGDTPTYSISGGADSALFSINSSTGALTFAIAPDFETPTDTGGNNVYDVTVQVSDGTNTDTQAISVTVTNVNDNTPSITSNGAGATGSVNAAENQTAVTTVTSTDVDGDTPTYSISGGTDQALFSINSSTGALTFASAPDFESPADAGGNNVYDVTVQVSDGANTDTQAISVTVTNVNDNAPSITSNGAGATGSVNAAENQAAVTTVAGTDADGDTLTYSISGGADAASFSINSTTGALTFASAPDFETPADATTDNIYVVTVQASDGGTSDTQTIDVTVTNVNDIAPVVNDQSMSVDENSAAGTAVGTVAAMDAEGDTLSYAITAGNTGSAFAIDSATGAITAATPSALDFETTPSFSLTVAVSDGVATDTATVTVDLNDVNEVVIGGGTLSGGGVHTDIGDVDANDDGRVDDTTDFIQNVAPDSEAVDGDHQCIGGCFDFTVGGLGNGASAQIVLPLTAALPTPASGHQLVYRKFIGGVWVDFNESAGDVKSAPAVGVAVDGTPATCPAPGDASYVAGLQAGSRCIELTIVDGGANDADGAADGSVSDPGGTAEVVPASTGGDGGGCTVATTPVDPLKGGDWWLLGGLLAWLGAVIRRRA